MLLQSTYTESNLITKYADFNIRVYPDIDGKEHFILWTKDLDFSSPPLVRVHSECITGDMLGSLHCDCGVQLKKSIELVSEEGGIIIYLRQEGRGIGLFEKMKSYSLQSKGYDTFEANVLLGHAPDHRSYEMVKTMLNDLKVNKIKLLTNNPSKVSDIAKLGIEIVDRIPILSRANRHNKKYLETKKQKFQHLSKKNSQHYFYQFHTDNVEQTEEIIKFISDKKKDPLLKICIGITIKSHFLDDLKEIERINLIAKACEKNSSFIPVIHFSFINSSNYLKDVIKIKKNWPTITRLQLNDLEDFDISFFKTISELFTIDIPLSDQTFDVLNNRQFIEFAKKTESCIMLDNSKGQGIKESQTSLMKKIEVLLSYGLNNIALCGGFGPDQLETYFQIRRYYRFNFSIDAETNLKTEGKIDISKVKLYLSQLIRFDDPNDEGVQQTKKFLEENRSSDWNKIFIQKYEFLIHPKVFQAGCFPSTSWFANQLYPLLQHTSNFCEIGCGAGVISCLVAKQNPNLEVIATDINLYATENTKLNAERLSLNSKIEVFTGDVLDSITKKNYFDLIFWALPFGFLDPGTPINLEEAQVFDPGYRAIRKLLETGKQYLNSNGRLLVGFSSDLGNYDLLENIAYEVGASIKVIAQTTLQEEVKVQFEILEILYTPI